MEDHTKIKIDFDPMSRRMKGTAIHGNTPFDVPFISQITDNLWQGGCEEGMHLPDFIDHVVSLYPWEHYYMRKSKPATSYLEVYMYDSEDQAFEQVDAIARWVNECRKTGTVLVHCQAGLNRSSLIAARALMLDGMTADEAIKKLREARSPACLCNQSFEKWLRSHDETNND